MARWGDFLSSWLQLQAHRKPTWVAWPDFLPDDPYPSSECLSCLPQYGYSEQTPYFHVDWCPALPALPRLDRVVGFIGDGTVAREAVGLGRGDIPDNITGAADSWRVQ